MLSTASQGTVGEESAHDQTLLDLMFSDLYLEPSELAWYKRSPGDRQRRNIVGAALEESVSLRRELQQHKTGLDFRKYWGEMGLRVQRIETLEGDLYVCRRLLSHPLPITSLGFPQPLIDALLSERLTKSGLILWTGGTGAGKSMSQISWLEERLKRYGGTACTIENPVEITLQGPHGQGPAVGTCYQTEIQSDDDYGKVIVRLLRAAPNVIMLGEIRTREAASQAVLAGTSGHSVSATLHANDIQTALERLRNMMREAGLDVSFMADSLSAVIHQSMSTTHFGGKETRHLTVTPLIIAGAANETGIRANIRSGEFVQLSSEIERQKRFISSASQNGCI